MEKLEQIITTYQQIIQETELELQNARKRIYYISLLRLILFVGAVANAIIFWSDGWLCLSAFAALPFILFIWLVKRHNLVLPKRLSEKENRNQRAGTTCHAI